jgi:hypothetical protein
VPAKGRLSEEIGLGMEEVLLNFGVVLRVIELSRLGFGRKLFTKDSSTLVNVSSVDLEAGFEGLT